MFVTNGGWGSVVAALRHGVPVVGAGTREGKNDINARVDVLGLGADLRSERPGAARVARAVREVLADQRIAANVARVRAELVAYDPLSTITAAVEGMEVSPAARAVTGAAASEAGRRRSRGRPTGAELRPLPVEALGDAASSVQRHRG